MWIVSCILIVPAPLKAGGCQLVRRQGARAWSEATSDDNGPLSIPGGIVSHDLGMGGHILRGELRQLIGLCMHPTKRLHVLKGAE